MRIINLLITSAAVIFGLLGAMLLVTIGFVIFALRRLFGRPAAMPRFPRPVRPATTRPAYSSHDEVIDVVTTEAKE